MTPTRRALLKGLGGAAVGGTLLWNVGREVPPALGAELLLANGGRAATIDIGDGETFRGFSDVVRIEAVGDPTETDDDGDGGETETGEDTADEGSPGQGQGGGQGQGQGGGQGQGQGGGQGQGQGGGQGQGQGQGGERGRGRGRRENDVIRITSLPKPESETESRNGDETGDNGGEQEGTATGTANETADTATGTAGETAEAVTSDYGISVVNVRNRNLTVRDIYEYEPGDGTETDGTETDEDSGGGAGGGTGTDSEADQPVGDGFGYEWLVTESDVTGVGTDHEMVSAGPDEAWLILQTGETEATTAGTETEATTAGTGTEVTTAGTGTGTTTGTPEPDPSIVEGFTLVFRTLYEDVEPNEWQTRTVAGEFRDIDRSPWKRFSRAERGFVPIGLDLLEAYGDATVHAVGVGRGDPFFGPSKLDTYYRNLTLNGETYELPVTYRGSSGRGNPGGGDAGRDDAGRDDTDESTETPS